jgi:hypothetical protein
LQVVLVPGLLCDASIWVAQTATLKSHADVMVGRQDCWSPVAQHEEIASLIPHAQLRIIEESGHMSPVEQPCQVSDVLLSWLGLVDKTKASLQPAAMG